MRTLFRGQCYPPHIFSHEDLILSSHLSPIGIEVLFWEEEVGLVWIGLYLRIVEVRERPSVLLITEGIQCQTTF